MGEMVTRVAEAIRTANQTEGLLYSDLLEQMARAAIEAMREPTKGMMPVGLDAIKDNMDYTRDSYATYDIPTEATAYHCFVDMIDAALAEDKPDAS